MKRTATIEIRNLKADELVKLSSEKLLSLSLDEMKAVQGYFKAQKREPTDVELETIAQTWSEHCKHKTFRGRIDYKNESESPKCPSKVYDDLLKDTIVKATNDLDKKFCLSVFEDNAGIIDFDTKNALAFKVETHNHPSALEPYAGAGTGIGGVIRDILGAGLGAKPVLNTDVFCVGRFGEHTDEDRETGMLSPERILSGVISGVRDYGNRMGIPTANGAVLFDSGYKANPLVFCGTVGVIPKDKIKKKVNPGDLVVAIGGRTGRDGIHGATFSSLALEKNISASVVQIGNAIVEKKVAEVILRARDQKLYRGLTDCGAGGFSSAAGELASECGARIDLEKAPLKYEGLFPWEIWVSESQERMVLAVPPEKLGAFQAVCATEDVECSVIGVFTNDKKLTLRYEGETVGVLSNDFLHKGIPKLRKPAVWQSPEPGPKQAEAKEQNVAVNLKKLISHPNIASKRWIVKQYDHEVQGGAIVKPFVGAAYDGPGDAAVYRPDLKSWKAFAVSNGINPLYGALDPYWMAANAIDEALRNLVAVGGNVDHCGILDNFCWGNIHDPKILGGLVRCSQACHDFAKAFGTPFISGKDSLNNTWKTRSGEVLSIPGTLLISAVGVVEDARKCVTMDLKASGNWIVLLGETKNEFGGSHFNLVTGRSGGAVPEVDAKTSLKMMRALHRAIHAGKIRSAHDLSEGGLGVALSEMCFAGGLGADIKVPAPFVGNENVFLFSESASRWVVEIENKHLPAFKKLFKGLPFAVLGKVQKQPALKVSSTRTILNQDVLELKKLWNAFSEKQ